MGRKKTIDREKVLDAAERVVREKGAPGLSIGAVAAKAGISKGGVQSCFGTRDALIDAMFKRWNGEFDDRISELSAGDETDIGDIRAFITAARSDMKEQQSRNAAMLLLLAQSEAHQIETRNWYRSRFDNLDYSSDKGRRLRMALLASEGAFMLSALGLTDFSDAEWDEIFRDITDLTR
ncbi:TetR/AcrR family transcriptional regulator [Hoeflea poritis]|uniref:TetR/AcrR family transcriptional regulator n=1 Tax=Hoeflea poritis TaxID=2993659 RepID=A0ABT4VR03_9HYPH|nr:TetR/AcrR family transcriptional regulator [Hoeflea poritis]MDA4847145.1 TetR/AcrR family transcriptional regulator [Hoeflea poritis]